MLESYSPYSLLSSSNPIFERERRHLTWQSSDTLPLFSTSGLYVIVVVGAALYVLAGMLSHEPVWNSTGRTLPLLIGLYFLLQVVVSLVADVYIIFQSINAWQARHQHEQWDIVRLTPVNEETLIRTYQALTQLRVWRVVQIENTLRLALPGVLVFVIALGSWLLPILLLIVAALLFDVSGLGTVAVFVALGYFVGQLGVAYLREPIWRLRVITVMSLWSAARFSEPSIAMLAGTASALGLHLFPLVVLVGIYMVTTLLLALPIGVFASGMIAAVWIGVIGFFFNRLARTFYVWLGDRYARRVIQLLRRGEYA